MKGLIRVWFGIIGAVSALPAMADSTSLSGIAEAAKRTGDKSREALVSIYGNVVNNPLATGGSGGGDTVLASVFQVTNAALLVIAGFFAGYMLFRKLTQSAHDGAVFDKQRHMVWDPIRIVWGLSALVPTANGWALSQLLMLWAASLMGVGIANLGVDASVQAFSEGKSMVAQPVMPSTVSLARSVFEMNLCMHSINAGLAQAEASGALITQDGYIQQNPTASGFALKNTSFVCGGADINASLEPQSQSTSWFRERWNHPIRGVLQSEPRHGRSPSRNRIPVNRRHIANAPGLNGLFQRRHTTLGFTLAARPR
ncbi:MULTISPECIES: DotA/TraY family protein [unclassified Pseudomonas]|uniref:DotA/TraY family protein n=1 Tax=unclassified Pseudomonas TaxID=196821 RepID=UPI000C2FA51C|nr:MULTISPECIES: DotA/TraY family protein [unclassified Pseudomonas]MCU1737535.1 DotA/TraY family protein [Pseudomonas sp. 20S_6.2_Bac1]